MEGVGEENGGRRGAEAVKEEDGGKVSGASESEVVKVYDDENGVEKGVVSGVG